MMRIKNVLSISRQQIEMKCHSLKFYWTSQENQFPLSLWDFYVQKNYDFFP